MDKEDMVHKHNGKLLSHKKELNNATGMTDLEIIIPSKVSQIVKDKHHMISLICGT